MDLTSEERKVLELKEAEKLSTGKQNRKREKEVSSGRGVGEVVQPALGTVDWVVVDENWETTTLVPLAYAHPTQWTDSPWILTTPTKHSRARLADCNCK